MVSRLCQCLLFYPNTFESADQIFLADYTYSDKEYIKLIAYTLHTSSRNSNKIIFYIPVGLVLVELC